MLHIFFAGNQYDWSYSEADVSDYSTDDQIKQSLSVLLHTPTAKFDGWYIDRGVTGEVTVRPNVVFG